MIPLRFAVLAGLGVLVAGIASAAPGDTTRSEAAAVVAQVTIPDQGTYTSAAVVAPPNATDGAGAFTYPADGSVVSVGSGAGSATVQSGTSSSAQATASAASVSIFGGEITVDAVDLRVTAAAGAANVTANTTTSTVTGLNVLGQPVSSIASQQLPVADWGVLDVLTSTTSTVTTDPRSASASVTGLRLHLVTDHGGLPAGSEIVLGNADAVAAATAVPSTSPTSPSTGTAVPPPATAAPGPTGTTQPATVPKRRPRPAVGLDPGTSIPGRPPELVRQPPEVTATLTSAGYVFPVFGPASFGDTFGAPRSDVSGGWHHGEDIFAPLGTPLLAVADGTVFSVGWNDIGGWRVWLRDAGGNEFYYAHLSAYSPLAVDGAHVKAGDVLGFMGNTGDASGGPVHLHFEIHPQSMLALGYDGVIAPYPYLVAWRRAEDVSFATGRAYVPSDGGVPRGAAPPAGAILLQAQDISRASGLVPGALERAVAGTKADESLVVSRGS